MGNRGIAKQDQEFLGQLLRFVDVNAIDNALKQKFIEKPFKLDLTSNLKDAFAPKPEEKTEKFSLMLEFKITIPADYKQAGHLDRFCKKYKNKFYFYNDDITDENFGTVSHKLIPGKTYLVKIWFINKGMHAISEEILNLLIANNAYLTGAQGTSILWQKKKDELPRGKWYIGMDKKENLPSADGDTLVPRIICDSDGDFRSGLSDFESNWYHDHCVIGFCDCEDSAA